MIIMDSTDTIKTSKTCADKQPKTESPQCVITSKEKNDTSISKGIKIGSEFYHLSRNNDLSKRAALSLSPKKHVEAIIPPLKETNKKTLVLDLDETLVHSTFDKIESPDVQIPIEIEGGKYVINVLIRPDAEWFIIEMSKYYEIILYTASLSKYADPLINKLDPQSKISHRLFREHCTYMDGIYIKDLTKLGRELKHTIIVDNSPDSYMMHHYNGIPIKSWYHEKDDIELKRICPILIKLNNFHDIRTEICKIVIDDIINWKKIEKWILKDKKKQIKSVDKCENVEFLSTDNEIFNKENERYQELSKKKEVSKENMNTPINKRLNGMKNNKTIQNFFSLNSKKMVKTIAKNNNNNNKTKNTTNTLSNLETTINNNTLNNTLQLPGSNENPKVQITNSSVGNNKNPSSSKSNLIKSCQKINTILSITTKKSNTNININSSQSFNRRHNKNELSLLLSFTNDESNIKQENKTRNLIYSLHSNKTCRTNAIVLNNTQESILNINEEEYDKKEQGPNKKNKSSRSIMKTKSKNPLSISNNHTKNNYSKVDVQHKSTSSIIKSVVINNKPSQRKLLINTIKIRKMNTTPRQINLSGFKEIDLTGKSENYNLEKSKANMTLKKSNYVKEIKEKILLNGNDPISSLGSEFSRNNAFLTNSLLYNSTSNVKVKIGENNFALNKSKQTSRFLVNHKKNISFKF